MALVTYSAAAVQLPVSRNCRNAGMKHVIPDSTLVPSQRLTQPSNCLSKTALYHPNVLALLFSSFHKAPWQTLLLLCRPHACPTGSGILSAMFLPCLIILQHPATFFVHQICLGSMSTLLASSCFIVRLPFDSFSIFSSLCPFFFALGWSCVATACLYE